METRRLGDTDLELTVIGLGTWAIGGSGWDYAWGAQKDRDSKEAIFEALEQGINWIDTAPAYGIGHSEEIVGQAVKEWGERVIVATKCGLLGDAQGHITNNLKPESIRRECEASLRRLQVETIDLYQIHWPFPKDEIERGFETLVALKAEGKIRWAGVSNFSAAQLDRISRLGHVSSLQPPYSLLNRGVEEDLLRWCAEHQTGVIVYSPLQTGLLTGKVTKTWVDALPADDWRKSKSPYYQEPMLSAGIAFVQRLQEIAAESGHSAAQLAIAWVLRRPEVTAAIVGARRRGQIAEMTPAAGWSLSNDVLRQIEEAFAVFKRQSAAGSAV